MSDLTDLISQCASEMVGDDVVKVAYAVSEATPSRHLREYYAESLTPLVRIVLGNERNSAAASVRRGRTHSAKTRAMRSAWDAYLDTVHAVGHGEYKPLRDVTLSDMDFIIETRRNQISGIQCQLDHYQRIKSAMLSEGVDVVGKLKGAIT